MIAKNSSTEQLDGIPKPLGSTIKNDKRHQNSIAQLWKNPRFSDITILVGENKAEYTLHRNIICLNSVFFDAACKEGRFVEGYNQTIKLPEIDAPEFEVVIRWLYDEGYQLPSAVYGSDFALVYKAADFLGMSGLKQEMVKQFVAVLKLERGAMAPRRIASPLTVLSDVADIAPVSDWELLRKIADEGMAASFFTNDGLLKIASGELGSPLFGAVMLDAYQNYIRLNTCISCVFTAKDDPGGSCRVCNKDSSLVPRPRRTMLLE
ncbi:hypothetical protein TWF281_009023 [Arthrobotrys megalospora]